MSRHIFLVEPEPYGRISVAIQEALSGVAALDVCATFETGRMRLLTQPPELLITNLRLKEYNGLHLVHLAQGLPTLCIVYATDHDALLAREVQELGAFYERAERMPLTVRAYVTATLPVRDRRAPSFLDRRRIFRGGRRATDLPALSLPDALQT